jgi:hypothetical protein
MMRKLAVTVFAMSLTLAGCGSSSSSKKDAAADGSTDSIVKTDTISGQDTKPNTDVVVPADTNPVDSAVDGQIGDTAIKLDMSGDTTSPTDTRDGSLADRVPDTFVRLDVALDTKTDAPVDSAQVVDAGLEAGGDAEID